MASIRQRNGRWQALVHVHGKLTSKTFDTKKQATTWATATEAARDRGEAVVARHTDLTVGAYWARLEPSRRAVLAAATVDRNATHWRLYLEPAFGSARLTTLRRTEVNAWVAGMVDRGVGVPTIESCTRLLSAIYEAAITDELVTANPVSRLRLPRHTPKRKRWVDPADIDAIVEQLDEPYALLVNLAAHTGLRWGEIAGLRRSGVDPMGRTITVTSVLTRRGVREYPKTDSSRRVVPVPADLQPALRDKLVGLAPDELVFAGPRGGGLSDRNVNERHLAPACERAGVEPITFHALRHYYASVMVAGGMGLAEVAHLLGHSSTRMVEQRYAHLQPGVHDRALETLASARSGKVEAKSARDSA